MDGWHVGSITEYYTTTVPITNKEDRDTIQAEASTTSEGNSEHDRSTTHK